MSEPVRVTADAVRSSPVPAPVASAAAAGPASPVPLSAGAALVAGAQDEFAAPTRSRRGATSSVAAWAPANAGLPLGALRGGVVFGRARGAAVTSAPASAAQAQPAGPQMPEPQSPDPLVVDPLVVELDAAMADPIQQFGEAVSGDATPADPAAAVARLVALRSVIATMTPQQRAAVAGDRALLVRARNHVSRAHFGALLAALGTRAPQEEQRAKPGGARPKGVPDHMSGDDADAFIKAELTNIPHLKPYLEAAVAAGKKADGFLAVVSDDDFYDLYEQENATRQNPKDEGRVNAFVATKHGERPAILNANRGTRSTAVHESMHRYSSSALKRSFGSPLNEGFTEYFTRRIANADGTSATVPGPQRSNYQDNHAYVAGLLGFYFGGDVAARDVVAAEIYFSGKLDALRDKFLENAREKLFSPANTELRWTAFRTALRAGDWVLADQQWTG